MSPEEAEAIVPNGWRMLKNREWIPKGAVMRMHKHLDDEWQLHDWGPIDGVVSEMLSNYYAVCVNEPRTEW